MKWRFSCPADICFTIVADSESEARERAKALLENYDGGVDIGVNDDSLQDIQADDVVVYTSESVYTDPKKLFLMEKTE